MNSYPSAANESDAIDYAVMLAKGFQRIPDLKGIPGALKVIGK